MTEILMMTKAEVEMMIENRLQEYLNSRKVKGDGSIPKSLIKFKENNNDRRKT